MKRLWICGCFALLCGACDDKTADEPVWNGDNYVTAFSLTVGEATYEAVVHDGRITVDVPYDASLDGGGALRIVRTCVDPSRSGDD